MIIVAGSINMDVVARTQHHPRPGETVIGNELHYIPGGKGSNQAVAASRLGGDVMLVGKLGQDAFGDTLFTFLQKEKLNLEHLGRDAEAPTGTALIVVNAESENTIVVVPGSNGKVMPEDVEAVALDADTVVLSQFEIPQPTIVRLYKRARVAGARTVLNPAPAAPFETGLLELVDYLIVNETELAFFSGSEEAHNDKTTLIELARQLRYTKTQTIIITLGAAGLLCVHGDNVLEVPGQKVKAVDTTGAGDCFAGALAVALSEGRELEAALRFANQAAALSVQRLGASASLPYRDELHMPD